MDTMKPGLPWYREPWPWLLMAGPAAVVAAGVVTIWLAVATADGLVVDDYYKRGLAINQTLRRGVVADTAGYEATLRIRSDADRLELILTTDRGAPVPEFVRLRFVHPTRSGLDRTLALRGAAGRFEGAIAALAPGRWNVLLEDDGGAWRLTGRLRAPLESQTVLRARSRD